MTGRAIQGNIPFKIDRIGPTEGRDCGMNYKLLKLMCVQVIVSTLSVSCLCCYNAFWYPCITYVLGIYVDYISL